MIQNRSSISRSTHSRPSTALNSSTTSLVKYPKCQVKKQHSKQVLNLLCLTSTCKNKGPICSLCKSAEHANHIVVPIKSFLQKISEKINVKQKIQEKKQQENAIQIQQKKQMMQPAEEQTKQPKQDKNLLEYKLRVIEESKNQMLGTLNLAVSQIAKKIFEIETQIMRNFDSLTQQIKSAELVQQNLSQHIQQLLLTPPEDPGAFKNKLNSMLSVIKINGKDKYEIGCSYEQKIEQYQQKSNNFVNNIENWMSISFDSLNDVYAQTQKTRLKTQVGKSMKFSAQLKSKSITLTNQNKVARQTDNKLCGFALVAGGVKDKTLTIKILALNSNIRIGICLKQTIKAKGYKFPQTGLGHGAFIISHNTYCFSHNDSAFNVIMKGFSFAVGDTIEVSYKGTQLKFLKKNQDKNFSMPLKKFTEAEQKQLAFCVWLGGSGDKVQILQ